MGGERTYFWLSKNGYPPGFRVLCFNCNAAMHMFGICPHEYAEGSTATVASQVS